MSIYHYNGGGAIDEITFRKTEKGAIRAYLHARPGTSLTQVQEILHTLGEQGMESIPYTFNNKPVLEVRGFKREDDLAALLAGKKYVEGALRIYDEKGDHHSWKDFLSKRSLQASGVAMATADIGFTVYGIMERNWKDTIAGLSYLSGSSVLTAYGRNDQSQLQIRQMANLILDYAREKGYDIPQDSSAALLGRRRNLSVLQRVDSFFRENPAEIGNSMYAVAGALIATSAVQTRILKKSSKKDYRDNELYKKERIRRLLSGTGDTILGASTITAGLLGASVKEKKHDPDTPEKHGFAAINEWIHERPLAAAGTIYLGSTLCHAVTTTIDTFRANSTKHNPKSTKEAIGEANKKLKAIPFRGLFIVSTLIGEVLLAISSKGHGEGVVSDKSVDRSAISVAAELIACQPEQHREQLIGYMGNFLGRQDVLAMKNDEVIQTLREQVQALCANPWVQCHSANASCSPQTQAKPDTLPAWQAKLAAETSAAQPQLAG